MTTIERLYNEQEELRIFPSLMMYPRPIVIENLDFTTMGLTKSTPEYVKGRKVSATYINNDGEVVVQKLFNDVAEGLEITIEWLCHDGSVGLRKTFTKPMSIHEKAEQTRKRRNRQISYLQLSAVGTPIESYVEALFLRYKTETEMYIQTGSSSLETVINAETEQPYITYLAIQVPSDDQGNFYSVKDSILNQIT